MKKICLYCGKEYNAGESCQKFCSRGCYGKSRGKGKDCHNWKGGKHLDAGGYVRITVGVGERVHEHRLVMEKHVGRQLKRSENVHHINGDKTDNRFENLQLMSIEEHSKLHAEYPTI